MTEVTTTPPATEAAPAPVSPPEALYGSEGTTTRENIVGTPLVETGTEEPAKEVVAPPAAEAAKGEAEAPSSTVVTEAPPLTPDSYTITLPETVKVDDSLLGEFKSLSAEAKLPPEVAQKVADLSVKLIEGQIAALTQSHADTQTAWRSEVLSWPEFKGERAAQTQATLGRLMDEHGTPEVRDIMNSTGVGNNPAFVRMMLNLANTLNEGSPTPGGRPVGQRRTAAETLYPNSK